MKNTGLSITAFIIVIFAIFAGLALFVFSDGVSRIEWMSLERAAWACLGMLILGGVLGGFSFRTPLGKVSAIIAGVCIAGFLFRLMSPSSPNRDIPVVREAGQTTSDNH